MSQLSVKHQAFVHAFLRTWNATHAYMECYPDSSYDAAAVSASELLRNPKIQAPIREHLDNFGINDGEVLMRLTRIARGDMGDFLKVDKAGRWSLDLKKAKARGQTSIVKKLTYNRKSGDVSIELYDAQQALVTLGKHLGLFNDRLTLLIKGELEKVFDVLAQGLSETEYDRVITLMADYQQQLEDKYG